MDNRTSERRIKNLQENPMAIDTDSRIPLYLQLKGELMDRIKRGVYAEDTQIPTEQQLMAETGLGRVTVRAALSELEREGVIEKRRGIGTFVSKRNPSAAFEPLISLSYSLKGMGIDGSNTIVRDEEFIADDDFINRFKLKPTQKLHYIRRLRSASGHVVVVEDSWFSEPLFQKIQGPGLEQSLVKLLLKKAALQVHRIDQTVVAREADQSERELLHLGDESKVLEMTRWLYAGTDTEPCYYLKFVVSSDAMAFPYENLAF